MKDNLKELHTLRIATEMWKSTVEVAQNILEETSHYQRLQKAKESLSKCEAEANALANQIRDESVSEYDWTLEENDAHRKKYDGIQIKEFKTIEVTDEKKAIKWAVESEQFNLVSLAKAQFNKVAKMLDLDFVKKDMEYRAQIASDLSMYENNEDHTRDSTSTDEE